MPYHFAIKESKRYSAYRAWRLLASPIVVGLMLGSFVLFAGATGLLLFVSSAAAFWGMWLLAGASFLALSLLFLFGSTYFPAQPLPKPPGENILDHVSFGLMSVLVPHVETDTAASLAQAVVRLLQRGESEAVLQRLGLETTRVQEVVEQMALPEMSWAAAAQQMRTVATALGAVQIEVEHALAAFLLHPTLKNFLREHDLQEQDVGFVTWWMAALRKQHMAERQWWQPERLLAFGGVGLSWTSGFTPLVDRFSRFPAGNLWDRFTVGREEYIEQLITTLARQRQSNVLMVGQPGTGRLGIVQAMARRVRTNRAHPHLDGQRVVYIHIGELLAQGSSTAGQTAAISQVLREMERAGNIIAVLDGLSSILGEGGEQRINLTEVLLPFFSSLAVRVVVLLNSEEYHLRLRDNEELAHFFEVIQVEGASEETTLQVLALATPYLEKTTGLYIPYATVRGLVEGTSGILPNIPLPERAFDMLEEAIVVAQKRHVAEVTLEMVNALISQKVGVPVGQLGQSERDYLLNLESTMHQRVVNQRRAVAAVARAMIRARTGVRDTKRPVGAFLFLGPTGVGKTETAKALAAAYFGSDESMLRLDMSEFQSADGLATLIGSSEQPVGRLTSAIADRPFGVVLLDEFEKAHRDIQQLFLQVFDEGHLTGANGQKVSFEHAIIIATSNAGAEFIRESLNQGALPADFDRQLREHILQTNIFRPELLNRFDGVITFTPLSPEHIKEIAVLMLKKLNKRLDAQHGVTVSITDDLLAFLVEIGYSPDFGARPMNRALQDTVEYAVARLVLQGHTQPGQEVYLAPEQLRAAYYSSDTPTTRVPSKT
jgi:ATP-dependent Clp protease ATP-binding subunit ClpC